VSGFGPGIFRDHALEQADAREALDERVRVVGLPRWIALALGFLVILGFVAWSASTEVHKTVDADGVISPEQGLQVLASPVAGIVTTAAPRRGTAVAAGQAVAMIDTGRPPLVEVKTVAGGSIEAVSAAAGSFVSAGSELATIQAPGAKPAGFLLVTDEEAAQLAPGKQVLLSPGLEESRATSLLEGKITQVDAYAATPARLTTLLGPARAAELKGGPALHFVEVELLADPSTRSGYAWTTGAGQPRITVGMPLTGRIVLSKKSPLSFILG
jgi:hypothetical protein